jgi:predicted lipoprotein with Yx(FWY)xxD motif
MTTGTRALHLRRHEERDLLPHLLELWKSHMNLCAATSVIPLNCPPWDGRSVVRRILAIFAVAALSLAGCGSDDGETTTEPEAPPEEEASGPTLDLATTDLGEVLVDEDGMTLYMFVPDQKQDGTPTCYDDCAESWPALEGEASAGDGIDESLLGTAEREDGTLQVTYNNLPLYHFSGDENAGDINGQGLSDVWWVVDAAGDPIMNGGG